MTAAFSGVEPRPRGRYREVWVGVFVITAVIAFFVALFMLTDPGTFRNRYHVTAIVDDAAGIRRNDPVLMRGVNVGRVRTFRLVDSRVAIDLEILGEYKIPSDSNLVLRPSNVLGEIEAEITPGKSTTAVGKGGIIQGRMSGGAIDKVGQVAREAEDTMGRLRALLSPKTVGNVEASGDQLVLLLQELTGATTDLRGLASTLAHTAGSVDRTLTAPELERTLANLDSLTDRLDGLIASLDRSAHTTETVMERLSRGEGSLGRLSRDDALYANANNAAAGVSKAAAELSALIADIRRDPKRYLSIHVF
jgi:phospholipid/cholesterol/gamma-HCH transport system substrate-binding protein